jgi:hypothetical protein
VHILDLFQKFIGGFNQIQYVVGCGILKKCKDMKLGNKITTGISHQLKNQAINKTESFVNNKANTFLNAFGGNHQQKKH